MILGITFAVSACALWGLTYLLPLVLPEVDALTIALVRAAIMGLVSVFIWIKIRRAFCVLTGSDWRQATALSLVGNLIQCWILLLSVAYAGVAVAGICFGMVPVLVALIANWQDKNHGKPFIDLSRLMLPLTGIVLGFIAVNFLELQALVDSGVEPSRFFFGLLCGIASTLMWTWYPIKNADWLLTHPAVNPAVWTCAQSIILLPIGALLLLVHYALMGTPENYFGAYPPRFWGILSFVGFACSWLATTLFNAGSARLPTSLVGQLLVFETIFAIVYGQIEKAQWPSAALTLGLILLLGSIIYTLRLYPKDKTPSS